MPGHRINDLFDGKRSVSRYLVFSWVTSVILSLIRKTEHGENEYRKKIAYTFHYPFRCTGPCNALFPLIMHQSRHRGRCNKKGHARLHTQHPRLQIHLFGYISKDPRPKPNPIKITLIRAMRDAVSRSTGIKGPCLCTERLGSHSLEIVG